MASFAASRLVAGPFDEAVVRDTAEQLRRELSGKPTFGLVFVTPDYAEKAAEFLELVRVYGHVPTLVGCSGTGLIGRAQEQEEGPGFSLMLVSLPGGTATALPFNQDMVEACPGAEYWRQKTGVNPANAKAWLSFLNPFVLSSEAWLKQWNQAYPKVPMFGCHAGGFPGDPEASVFCDDRIVPGGVTLALEGNVVVHPVVSQGCKPIGEPLTVTQAERNVLLTLGSRPAYEVLCEVYKELSDAEREQARGHLFAGLAVSEYLEEYKRGDFLVRNIIGADRAAALGPACCCPANPVVRVILPATATRPHRTELLLCGHHYRVSSQALAAANATVSELLGPEGSARVALLPDLPAERVPVG